MLAADDPFSATLVGDGAWRVTFDNPPINLLDPDVISGVAALMSRWERAGDVKVVVFDSADPDFFFAHVDLLRVDEEGSPTWPELAARMEQAPFVTIGSIRGRARGVGNEFLLALDMRFASIERAVLGQPEIGFGFVPGGGGLERLPRLVGRARALEVVVGGDDVDALTAERYGWINRALPDDELDSFVDHLVHRISSFDRDAIAVAKAVLNERVGLPSNEDQQSSETAFRRLLDGDEVQRRMRILLERGLQQRGEVELDLADAIVDL